MDNKQLNIPQVYLDNPDCEELCIFNGFQLALLPGIFYFMDGQQGKRVLFLTDEKETFIISFEQGMNCLDIDLSHTKGYTPLHCEYRQQNGLKQQIIM